LASQNSDGTPNGSLKHRRCTALFAMVPLRCDQ